jgi:hypothetical protein
MGQGTISYNGCTDTFDINVFPGKKKPAGSLDFYDPCAGILLTQVKVTSLYISGDFAEIRGTAKLGKKTKVSFDVIVLDQGSPNQDYYQISLSNGYFAAGYVTSGGITIK